MIFEKEDKIIVDVIAKLIDLTPASMTRPIKSAISKSSFIEIDLESPVNLYIDHITYYQVPHLNSIYIQHQIYVGFSIQMKMDKFCKIISEELDKGNFKIFPSKIKAIFKTKTTSDKNLFKKLKKVIQYAKKEENKNEQTK